MLLYGMDGDPKWRNRHTRFLSEVYAGDELEVEYSISDKKEEIPLCRRFPPVKDPPAQH